MGLSDLLTSVDRVTQGVLTGPVQDFNTFMGRINQAITDPIGSLGDITTALGIPNPYAQENVLEVMLKRGEGVLAFDWIGVILDPNPGTALPWYYIDTFSTPDRSIDPTEQFFNGRIKKAAGALRVSNITLGCFCDTNAVSYAYMDAWMRSTQRDDRFYNLPSAYKKDVAIFILDSRRKTVTDIRFTGCFPLNIGGQSFGTDSGIIPFEIQLSVDDSIMNTETSLSRAFDRYKSIWPGVLADAGSSLLNIPAKR